MCETLTSHPAWDNVKTSTAQNSLCLFLPSTIPACFRLPIASGLIQIQSQRQNIMIRRFLSREVGNGLFVGCLLLCPFLLTTNATAQYQVTDWASFEEGGFPKNGKLFGLEPSKFVSVIEYSKMPGMPPQFSNPKIAKEIGRYGMLLKGTGGKEDPANPHLIGLTIGGIVDRDQLGANGRTIYQCDFFVPTVDRLPAIAVMASDATAVGPDGGPITFYRFGFHMKERLYFSFVTNYSYGKNIKQEAVPVYQSDKSMFASIPKPGWHRMAVVFEGSSRIRCFVDGRETSFSPLEEPKLRKLAIGIMHTSREGDSIIDNLSIQTTTDANVMPVSPYSDGWTIVAGSKDKASGQVSQVAPVALAAPVHEDMWVDQGVAWTTAQQQKKPLFICFYAPGVAACEEVNKILGTDPGATSLLKRCVCTRIDVNQLQGGLAARQYNVFKVPTLFLISPDAKTYKRTTFRKGSTWAQVAAELSGI